MNPDTHVMLPESNYAARWIHDAVTYAPKTPPGCGPWRRSEWLGMTLCPDCQRRISARGLSLPLEWKFEVYENPRTECWQCYKKPDARA